MKEYNRDNTINPSVVGKIVGPNGEIQKHMYKTGGWNFGWATVHTTPDTDKTERIINPNDA